MGKVLDVLRSGWGPRSHQSTARRFCIEFLESRLLPATFTVTDTSDDINDTGSLRHAITQSNLTGPGPNTINFNIPGTGVKTIAPLSALPVITKPVIIDGTSQPGFTSSPLIELDGQHAGTGSYGLAITAGGSTVEGLVINRFSKSGIVIEGGGGNSIVGNLIGIDSSGLRASGNFGDGVFIFDSPNNTVGGTVTGARNIISGNGFGIDIDGSTATGNVVQGNYIGTNQTGEQVVANFGAGIRIDQQASNNLIGGATTAARNLISGNIGHGRMAPG
jgi:hypothetical protein